ncbi:MAG TPA: excinuclease ABC subunit UvrB [Thermoplasmata archaeon]|nr:excinuclease ABC subunit UvrB [Thermoplasmata archaeon]
MPVKRTKAPTPRPEPREASDRRASSGQFQLETELTPQGDQPKAIEELARRIRGGERYQTLLGVTGSGKTFTMAEVVEHLQRPTLVISPNKTLAAQLVSEFRALFPRNAVEYFVSYYDYYQPEAYVPQIDLYVEKDAQINEEIDKLRHRATQALLTRRDVLVVASVSCIFGLGSPTDYQSGVVDIERGATLSRQELLHKLVHSHYARNDVELQRGRFRVRGGTIDVMSSGETVHRIVLEGDRVAELAELDPTTREEIRPLERLSIFPASHFLTMDERREEVLRAINTEKEERVAELTRQGHALEAQRLKSRTEYDLEMIRETGTCSGIENYSRHFTGRKPGEPPYTLLDFFPKDLLVFLDESHVTLPQLQGMYRGDLSRKDNLVEFGWRLPSCRDNRPLKFPEFLARVPQLVFVSATPAKFEREHSSAIVEQVIRPTGLVDPPVEVRPLEGHIADLVGEIRTVVERGERALVTTLTKRTAEDLANHFAQLGMKVRYLHSDVETMKRVEILRDLRLGRFDVLVGINLLREGLDLPEVSLVAVLDADKEGYLRSESALIQTVGRASRNVRGKAILYADRTTGSMERAMSEMRRRRELQLAFNAEHGIVPETIRKEVRSILAEGTDAESGDLSTSGLGKKWKERLPMLLANLEEEMRIAAEQLDFEEAARIRDRIRELELRAGLAGSRTPERAGTTA